MDVEVAKYLAMVLTGGVSLFLGLLPLCLGKYFVFSDEMWKRTLTSALLCFGGGVLFATAMVHLLPEVILNFTTQGLKNAIVSFFSFSGQRKSQGLRT